VFHLQIMRPFGRSRYFRGGKLVTTFFKNSRVWSAGLIGAAALLFAGCGGDDDDGGDCVPSVHNPCNDEEPALTDPEGGAIYFEYMDFSAEVQAAGFPDKAVRLMGHFVSEMDPDAFPLPTGCSDLTNTPGWPTGMSDTMTELNVGNLELINGDTTLVVEPGAAGPDFISREHTVSYQAFLADETDTYIKPDSAYDLHITGSDTYPETTYPGAFYFPPAFDVTSPLNEATAAPITGDWEMTWDKNDAANGTEQFQIVMLVSPDGAIIHQFCPGAHTGTHTVPEDALTKFRATYPNGGLLLRGNITHQLGRFDNGAGIADRRIDFVSMYCYVQPFAFEAE